MVIGGLIGRFFFFRIAWPPARSRRKKELFILIVLVTITVDLKGNDGGINASRFREIEYIIIVSLETGRAFYRSTYSFNFKLIK